jgi:hypothetical protein
MEDYKAKGGVEITNDMIDQWDEDAEKGIYHGTPGEFAVHKSFGRLPLYEKPMVPVTFRMSDSEANALRAIASKRGVSFADIMREACHRELGRSAT